MKKKVSDTIQFACGQEMKNRFMLAPLTNTQSHEDGRLSEDEFHWLSKRAEGQFGLVMTCATQVHPHGKGFPGQLGIYADSHMDGHKKLAKAIQSFESMAVVQLHHAGMRSPKNLINGEPLCPSNNEKHGARAMTLEEVHQVREAFIKCAKRAQKCGYNGVEIHGAHGYLLCQFLSATINKRSDDYGGSLENRSRLLFEIIDGIRQNCGDTFFIAVRLSPERFGMDLGEIKAVCKQLVDSQRIDCIDLSIWDIYKYPEYKKYAEKPILSHFTELDYDNVQLTVAGKIRNGNDVSYVMNKGVDFVTIGRSAILHYNFTQELIKNPNFEAQSLPVTTDYLKGQGLGNAFIQYLQNWPGFVKD